MENRAVSSRPAEAGELSHGTFRELLRNSGQVSKKSPAGCGYAGRDRGSVFLCYARIVVVSISFCFSWFSMFTSSTSAA